MKPHDPHELLFEYEGYGVSRDENSFYIWAGMPSKEMFHLDSMPLDAGTAGAKMWIQGYQKGCTDGGQRRAALIKKALGL